MKDGFRRAKTIGFVAYPQVELLDQFRRLRDWQSLPATPSEPSISRSILWLCRAAIGLTKRSGEYPPGSLRRLAKREETVYG
jgi:hypothetical protein